MFSLVTRRKKKMLEFNIFANHRYVKSVDISYVSHQHFYKVSLMMSAGGGATGGGMTAGCETPVHRPLSESAFQHL